MKFFANHVLSFAHMVPLSILDTQDNCPCVCIGNSEKIHDDFLWGPQKIEINKKSWIWLRIQFECYLILYAFEF